jgi:hypothetical protein
MTPFGLPLDRPDVHLTEQEDSLENQAQISNNLPSGISVSAEAAARVLTQAAKRIRNGESVRDVCEGLVDVVIALSGRI